MLAAAAAAATAGGQGSAPGTSVSVGADSTNKKRWCSRLSGKADYKIAICTTILARRTGLPNFVRDTNTGRTYIHTEITYLERRPRVRKAKHVYVVVLSDPAVVFSRM